MVSQDLNALLAAIKRIGPLITEDAAVAEADRPCGTSSSHIF
jgi:hypothetical protein